MYGVVTEIIEKLSGKTWEENVKEILYDPIGMSTSKFLTKVNQQTDDIATGYNPDDETGSIVVSPFAINEYVYFKFQTSIQVLMSTRILI